ncbi:MAG TPA: TonB family protein [Terriglobales bacterium]|nr:TonB family protein [Terriglobales bacterium]
MASTPREIQGFLPLEAELPDLHLLIELPPWHRVFFGNMVDFLHLRRQPRYWYRYAPAQFWDDVFVARGIPWSRVRQSAFAHIFVILAIYGLTDAWTKWYLRQPRVQLRTIVKYDLSEYLPPLETGSEPAPAPRKGQPKLARQHIISLPRNPDNREQTIISAPDVKLPSNIPLPNIVAWTPVPGVPTALAHRDVSQIRMPNLPNSIIAPPPETYSPDLSKSALSSVGPKIIPPPPDAASFDSTHKLNAPTGIIGPPPSADLARLNQRSMNAPTPSVIGPPPDANLSRNLGTMNIGHMTPTVSAPKFEVAEQRAIQLAPSKGPVGRSQPTRGGSAAAGGAPPINPVGGIKSGPDAGQFIALNVNPVVPNGPLRIPPGRRSGEFEVGPEGKPDAPGTPEIKAGGTGPGGSGTGSSGGAGKSNSQLPSGISIANTPGAPAPGSVVVSAPNPEKRPTPSFADAAREVLSASARPPRIGEIPRDTRSGSSAPEMPKIEGRVFGTKKVYTLALNMPNLTSSGGSWIIRFAELGQERSGAAISAPVAMTKVDPAYPAELMRDGVEGTVILYAVIHKDGTVGDVRVIKGVQEKLNESARLALTRWKFRPGTKNGEAVELEAVVQIPFKAPRFHF